MITEGGFIKRDDLLGAPVVYIICPNCKVMTCVEPLDRDSFYCLECDSIWSEDDK